LFFRETVADLDCRCHGEVQNCLSICGNLPSEVAGLFLFLKVDD
jgi:hypothetical protein